jgi:hypothetical protein
MSENHIVNIHGKDYLTVAGRVEKAHEKNEKKLSIQTDIQIIGKSLVAKATVETDKGIFTGTSAINASAQGIAKSSPYEVVETSAVGRALGFAGYGIIEGNIASADEMTKAYATQEETPLKSSPTRPQTTVGRSVYCQKHKKPMVPLENGRIGHVWTKTDGKILYCIGDSVWREYIPNGDNYQPADEAA